MRYNQPMAKRKEINYLLRNSYRVIVVLVMFVGELLVSAASFLSSSAKTSNINEASENAIRGGVLNYRTGQLDDGTDAAGWYEKD